MDLHIYINGQKIGTWALGTRGRGREFAPGWVGSADMAVAQQPYCFSNF